MNCPNCNDQIVPDCGIIRCENFYCPPRRAGIIRFTICNLEYIYPWYNIPVKSKNKWLLISPFGDITHLSNTERSVVYFRHKYIPLDINNFNVSLRDLIHTVCQGYNRKYRK